MGLVYIKNIKGDIISYDEDPLNKTGYRNINNTDIADFNCGGWALNIFEWLVPFLHLCTIDRLADIEKNYMGDNAPHFIRTEDEREELHYEICDEFESNGGDIYVDSDWNSSVVSKLSIEHLLATFDDMRVINSFDELKDDEYGIVFGTTYSDFHFARYLDGIITAKCGDLPIKEYESVDAAMRDYPDNRTYFARKIQVGMDNNY